MYKPNYDRSGLTTAPRRRWAILPTGYNSSGWETTNPRYKCNHANFFGTPYLQIYRDINGVSILFDLLFRVTDLISKLSAWEKPEYGSRSVKVKTKFTWLFPRWIKILWWIQITNISQPGKTLSCTTGKSRKGGTETKKRFFMVGTRLYIMQAPSPHPTNLPLADSLVIYFFVDLSSRPSFQPELKFHTSSCFTVYGFDLKYWKYQNNLKFRYPIPNSWWVGVNKLKLIRFFWVQILAGSISFSFSKICLNLMIFEFQKNVWAPLRANERNRSKEQKASEAITRILLHLYTQPLGPGKRCSCYEINWSPISRYKTYT